MNKLFAVILLVTTFFSCSKHIGYHYSEHTAPSRNKNVCGNLKDNVILYCIFVDVHAYHPFSAYDIESTMDSVHKATKWLECQAEYNNIPLNITPVLHKKGSRVSFHERKTLVRPYLHLFKKPLTKKKYAQYTNQWADYICHYAGRSVKQKNTAKVGTKVKAHDLESLIHILRNNYETDGLAVMFFVNGYYERDMCMAFNIYNNGPTPEYAVITHKSPGAITHEFLHLFGGIDLYPHAQHPGFNYKDIKEEYPNEIMRISHKNLDKLMLSPITKYYIGWKDDLPKSDLRMLYHYAEVLEY